MNTVNKIFTRNFSMADAELAYTSFPNSVRCFDYARGSALSNNKKNGGRIHPTQKPVELIERAVNNSSKGGDVIIDLFGGSGSTLIACEKLNRNARLMELDPKYCDVIVQRWQDFTGKQAKLEGSGGFFPTKKGMKQNAA